MWTEITEESVLRYIKGVGRTPWALIDDEWVSEDGALRKMVQKLIDDGKLKTDGTYVTAT